MEILEMTKAATPKKDKRQLMREKILSMPIIELTGDNIIDNFKIGKKIKLEVEAELLSERRGLERWQLAEGEKQKDSQTAIIHKVKILK